MAGRTETGQARVSRLWEAYVHKERQAREAMGSYLANHKEGGSCVPTLLTVATACRRADAAADAHLRALGDVAAADRPTCTCDTALSSCHFHALGASA